MVPLGPRFVRMTSCRPFAALMFMNSAAVRPMTSAFEFSDFTAMAANVRKEHCCVGASQAAIRFASGLALCGVQIMVIACPHKLCYAAGELCPPQLHHIIYE